MNSWSEILNLISYIYHNISQSHTVNTELYVTGTDYIKKDLL